MAQCQEPVSNDGKTFSLVFTYIWKEGLAKNSKVPNAPRIVNPARSITWLVA